MDVMITICWTLKGTLCKSLKVPPWAALSSLSHCASTSSLLVFQMNSQLHSFISEFSLGCAWVHPLCAVAQKPLQGCNRLGESQGSPYLFSSFWGLLFLVAWCSVSGKPLFNKFCPFFGCFRQECKSGLCYSILTRKQRSEEENENSTS